MRDFLSSRADEVEKALLDTTKSLLGIDEIALSDNFFDLGGHSILAARLLSRMEPVIGQRAPLRYVFETQDMRELSARLVSLSEPDGSG